MVGSSGGTGNHAGLASVGIGNSDTSVGSEVSVGSLAVAVIDGVREG